MDCLKMVEECWKGALFFGWIIVFEWDSCSLRASKAKNSLSRVQPEQFTGSHAPSQQQKVSLYPSFPSHDCTCVELLKSIMGDWLREGSHFTPSGKLGNDARSFCGCMELAKRTSDRSWWAVSLEACGLKWNKHCWRRTVSIGQGHWHLLALISTQRGCF